MPGGVKTQIKSTPTSAELSHHLDCKGYLQTPTKAGAGSQYKFDFNIEFYSQGRCETLQFM